MLLWLRSLYFFVSFSPKIQPTLKQSWHRTFELRRWGAWQQQCLDTDKWLWRLSYIDNALWKLRIKVMVVSTYISVNLSSKKQVFYACRPYSDLFRIRDWSVAVLIAIYLLVVVLVIIVVIIVVLIVVLWQSFLTPLSVCARLENLCMQTGNRRRTLCLVMATLVKGVI